MTQQQEAVAGSATIVLPDASSAPWWVAPSGAGQSATPGKSGLLTIYHRAGSGGTCTVQAQNVGGVQQKVFTSGGGAISTTVAAASSLCLRSDGTNWFAV